MNYRIKRFQEELMFMFDPREWTKQLKSIHGIVRIIYVNEHTGLAKLRCTFTKEQQKALEREDKKLSHS
jgi:hypothetical protein